MIKAVVFDCFGVLVGRGYWEAYRSLGGDPDKDAAMLDSLLDKRNLGKIDGEQLATIVSSHLGISIDKYHQVMRADQVPNLEVFDLVRELKPRFKVGMLSNVTRSSLEQKVPEELLALFDTLVLSGEVNVLKPDPAIYQLAASRLDLSPQEIVFTDDHEDYIVGAQKVGMQTILFKNLDSFKRQLAELT